MASGARPWSAAKPSEVSTTAAAASLTPEAFPAVMENPSISGCRTFNEASFSMEVPRRGCSSTSKTTADPSLVVTLIGTISLAKRPSSMAAMAR